MAHTHRCSPLSPSLHRLLGCLTADCDYSRPIAAPWADGLLGVGPLGEAEDGLASGDGSDADAGEATSPAIFQEHGITGAGLLTGGLLGATGGPHCHRTAPPHPIPSPSPPPPPAPPPTAHLPLPPAGQARHLGVCPETGLHVFLRAGLYGPYVQRGKDGDPLFNRQSLARVSRWRGLWAVRVLAHALLLAQRSSAALALVRPAWLGRWLRPCVGKRAGVAHVRPLPCLPRPPPCCAQSKNLRGVTLDVALSMLALPKDLGPNPATGGCGGALAAAVQPRNRTLGCLLDGNQANQPSWCCHTANRPVLQGRTWW